MTVSRSKSLSASTLLLMNSTSLSRCSTVKHETMLLDNLSSVIPTINDSMRNILNNSTTNFARKYRSKTVNIPTIEVTPPTPLTPPEPKKSFVTNALDKVLHVGETLDICRGKIRRFSDPCVLLGNRLNTDDVNLKRRMSMPTVIRADYLKVPKPGNRNNKKRRNSLPSDLGKQRIHPVRYKYKIYKDKAIDTLTLDQEIEPQIVKVHKIYISGKINDVNDDGDNLTDSDDSDDSNDN